MYRYINCGHQREQVQFIHTCALSRKRWQLAHTRHPPRAPTCDSVRCSWRFSEALSHSTGYCSAARFASVTPTALAGTAGTGYVRCVGQPCPRAPCHSVPTCAHGAFTPRDANPLPAPCTLQNKKGLFFVCRNDDSCESGYCGTDERHSIVPVCLFDVRAGYIVGAPPRLYRHCRSHPHSLSPGKMPPPSGSGTLLSFPQAARALQVGRLVIWCPSGRLLLSRLQSPCGACEEQGMSW